MSESQTHGTVADAKRDNWVDRFAPDPLKPYMRLARLDRPIGFWLLFWPCAFSLGLSAVARPMVDFAYGSLILFWIGAVVMRGAGCTLNDIVDRKIDASVARTRSRPIPSGQVSVRQAIAFLAMQLLAGLWILVQFNSYTVLLGVASLGLVVIYPFMKRITWWPQLFLGLAFSWGALMGWASEFGVLFAPPFWLYLGSILWVIGYDTIYALQDREDDALIGVKSTARLFGSHVRLAVAIFYGAAFAIWIWAGLSASAGNVFLIAMVVPGILLAWQVVTLDTDDPENCLVRFRSNQWVGLAFTLALWLQFRF